MVVIEKPAVDVAIAQRSLYGRRSMGEGIILNKGEACGEWTAGEKISVPSCFALRLL